MYPQHVLLCKLYVSLCQINKSVEVDCGNILYALHKHTYQRQEVRCSAVRCV